MLMVKVSVASSIDRVCTALGFPVADVTKSSHTKLVIVSHSDCASSTVLPPSHVKDVALLHATNAVFSPHDQSAHPAQSVCLAVAKSGYHSTQRLSVGVLGEARCVGFQNSKSPNSLSKSSTMVH
eukprot:574615_1